jgi:hypothetical protein
LKFETENELGGKNGTHFGALPEMAGNLKGKLY